jgi:hypothetical protein
VKSLEVCGVVRDDGVAVGCSEAKVNLIILPVQVYPIVGRPSHLMPNLSKEVRQEIGIRAVVKI